MVLYTRHSTVTDVDCGRYLASYWATAPPEPLQRQYHSRHEVRLPLSGRPLCPATPRLRNTSPEHGQKGQASLALTGCPERWTVGSSVEPWLQAP